MKTKDCAQRRPGARSRGGLRALLLASFLGASACQDPLVDPAVVLGPRVIGARVRAERDPSLAEPSPSERASIDWLVLSDQPGTFAARAVWCRGEPSSLGPPRCAGAPTGESSAPGSYDRTLSFAFQVPDGLEPGEAWLVWLGVCEAGEPLFDAARSAFECPGAQALEAFYRGFVPEQAPNRNPSLADDAVSLDGAAWSAADAGDASLAAAREPCSGSVLPSFRAGDRARVTFELTGDDREPIGAAPGEYAARPRESLVYTHVASHPGLERAFSAIDYDAETTGFELELDSSGLEPGPGGETVIFHLLVRDERGGVDWLRREACLLPP